MATLTLDEKSPHPKYKFLNGPPIRLSWSSVFAGVVASLGVWALLYAFGLALGLSSINPDNPESAKGSGLFAGIWGMVVPLIALFVGGAVAGRGAGIIHRGGGALHGLVMWGLTTVLGAFLVGNLLTSALSGVVSIGGGVAKQGSVLAGASQGGEGMFSLDANSIIQPVNERLQAEGKPAITADQLSAATRDVVNDAARTGTLNRETLISSIAQNTALSRADAEDIAGRVEAQWSQTGQNVKNTALQAADTTGKAFWGVFGALLLGLVSAVVGGVFGVSRRQERWDGEGVIGYSTQPLHE
jgi:hypothetical protein